MSTFVYDHDDIIEHVTISGCEFTNSSLDEEVSQWEGEVLHTGGEVLLMYFMAVGPK